jgi:hypothetical protein
MSEIEVVVTQVGAGWLTRVSVSDRGSTRDFEVTVSVAELERLDPDASEPTELVRRSVEFLLARERKDSILPSFGLSVIGRYFPEYQSAIQLRP